jgi:CheY-like chemotaxis protein
MPTTPHVLVVDDQPDFRESIASLLATRVSGFPEQAAAMRP